MASEVAAVAALAREAFTSPGMKTISALLGKIASTYKSRSAAGVSLPTLEMEVVGYSLMLTSSLQRQLAFSAYGEQAIVLLQNVVLLVLLYVVSKESLKRIATAVGVYAVLVAVLASGALDAYANWAVPFSTVIFLYSRCHQVYTNYKAQSTGALSFMTTAMQLLGAVARVFTTIQHKGGIDMVLSYAASFLLSGLLLLQIMVYARNKKPMRGVKVPTRRSTAARIRTKLA